MSEILVTDITLRDGSHAVGHTLTVAQLKTYAAASDAAGVQIIEVGHGNGLGASSLQLGESTVGDIEMVEVVKAAVTNARVSVHVIPGFATIERDLKPAIAAGADVIRVASHCTEADTTERHITFAREQGREVYGVLMMSHMAPVETLIDEARKMEQYGAEGVILMDSAGAYLPRDATAKVTALVDALSIPVGFHAHNNLGLAVGTSLAAAQAGAYILDGAARGFGAGAGNAQLEALVAVLDRYGYDTGVDLYGILDAGDVAQEVLVETLPFPKSTSIVSGLAGVFSGFARPVERVSAEYGVDPRDVWFELGRRGIVAGQEDLIIEVARTLSLGKDES
jgi:4-hydroxy 2-oxovalerate aldolase